MKSLVFVIFLLILSFGLAVTQLARASFEQFSANNSAISQNKLLRVGLFGLRTKSKERLFYSLLGLSPTSERESDGLNPRELLYKFSPSEIATGESLLVVQKESVPRWKNNVVFLMIDDLSLMNEQLLLSEMIDCVASLQYSLGNNKTTTENSTSLPLIMVVYSGTETQISRVQLLLREAWNHCQVDTPSADVVNGNFSTSVMTRFIHAPSFQLSEGQQLSPRTVEIVNSLLQDILQHLPAPPVETDSPRPKVVSAQVRKSIAARNDEKLHTMDVFLEAVQAGLEKAVHVVNDEDEKYMVSLNKLQLDPTQFSVLMEEIILRSFQRVDEFVELRSGRTIMSSEVRTALRREVLIRIFKSFAPLFHRQVQLLKQAHIEDFNELVTTENLPVSVFIDEDLRELQSQTLASFSTRVRQLLPRRRDIASLVRGELYWTALGDEVELQTLLKDFVDKQITKYRVLGVLSRQVRKPIGVSAHAFVAHPLGIRDYRQDVLTSLNDVFEYDEEVAALSSSLGSPSTAALGGKYSGLLQKVRVGKSAENGKENGKMDESFTPQSPVLVTPKLARALLQSEAQSLRRQSTFGWSWLPSANFWKLRQVESQSEIAREMLMFPLCIKNPAVPMACPPDKRASRRVGVPTSSHHSEASGPERYIRWDIEPLDEVKTNLEDLEEQTKQQPISIMDKFLNLLPQSRPHFYQHPVVNYGKEFAR